MVVGSESATLLDSKLLLQQVRMMLLHQWREGGYLMLCALLQLRNFSQSWQAQLTRGLHASDKVGVQYAGFDPCEVIEWLEALNRNLAILRIRYESRRFGL
jgi:hypothetical protein